MAYEEPQLLVSTDWLGRHIGKPDIRIIDGSWHLPNAGRDGRAEFAGCHIPGAVFFDIDEICDRDSALPHMAPPPEVFVSKLRHAGIGDGHQIVVYDSVGMFSAARVWWLFRYMGFFDVAVLDGGLPKWMREGRETTAEVVAGKRYHLTPRRQSYMLRQVEEVARASDCGGAQIIDARPSDRFRGEAQEPRPGLRSGHIPNSLNIPYSSLLRPDRTFKSHGELTEVFAAAGVNLDQPVITSCGSGVAAAIISLALEILGHRDHSLYDGSWSEWGGRADLPIETG
ncbi:MAG: 3-mercaptopyruvate sulfurtransferase [Rhodobacteraceae bacterium]|nr:3-mercaptopyruvate sulfurtransferase [Paracoccaceae bacterium]